MSLKVKLGLGLATAVMGISLIGGGTYAYFTSTESTTGTFAAGYIDLTASPTTVISVSDIKPGDTWEKSFSLKNTGTVDIAKVLLHTTYEVGDYGSNNQLDLGKYIRVDFLRNATNDLPGQNIIGSKTLYELQQMTNSQDPDVVKDILGLLTDWIDNSGLDKINNGETNDFKVKFTFVNDGDQSQFQRDSLTLHWDFEAQTQN
ncbi:TasA family protein [Paenibacillus sacheonensis]|uniref:Cell division protein FtsN n=1 Tax=Paenibacillus sacheonensis TaxID=742054 RepID=A0A7X4YVJ0_9BACL|nr:TasA family protein [Paenibacillus sacheonensis]MBM7568006.1 spore coat-associated protein N [Paenibacillus sacheonensis]NBC73213.1 cell division protein FtsN [Paenibacillus sacheonensis]